MSNFNYASLMAHDKKGYIQRWEVMPYPEKEGMSFYCGKKIF